MFASMSRTESTVPAWVRSDACSMDDMRAAGTPLPETSAIAISTASPTGTTS
jgi:hypothetical protein